MKFGKHVAFLFLICTILFYLVTGKTVNEETSDCTKLLNFINGDSKDYANSCCSEDKQYIECDDEGHVITFRMY